MTSLDRQELLAVLSEVSVEFPNMRFGQLILNLATVAGVESAEALWEMEDEALLAAAKKQVAFLAGRREEVASTI